MKSDEEIRAKTTSLNEMLFGDYADRPATLAWIQNHNPCVHDPETVALTRAMEEEQRQLRNRLRDWYFYWPYYLNQIWWNIMPFAWVWRWQRMRRGWSDYDAWNLDVHIACMIADGGKHLRDYGIADHEDDERFAEFIEGMRHYADGCDFDCPAVVRAMELLPTQFPKLWD